MAGPNIQMPASVAQMFDFTKSSDGEVTTISMKPEWASLISTMQGLLYAETRSGPTAERPTSDFKARYIGVPYFDTSLGLPVFLKTASSNAWVKADGTPA